MQRWPIASCTSRRDRNAFKPKHLPFPCPHCFPGPPAAAVPRNCVRLDPTSTNATPTLQPRCSLIASRYYLDPDTNERLSTWRNPLNNASVTVVHVSNDPVNNPVFGPLPLVNAGGSTQVSQATEHAGAREEITCVVGAAIGRSPELPQPSLRYSTRMKLATRHMPRASDTPQRRQLFFRRLRRVLPPVPRRRVLQVLLQFTRSAAKARPGKRCSRASACACVTRCKVDDVSISWTRVGPFLPFMKVSGNAAICGDGC